MGMSFFDALKVLKGTEVEAPRIIPPNHTPNHTPESYPRIIPLNSSFCNIPGFQNFNIYRSQQYQKSRTNLSLLPLLLLFLPFLLSFCSSSVCFFFFPSSGPTPCFSPSLLLILLLAPPHFPRAAASSFRSLYARSFYSFLLIAPF